MPSRVRSKTEADCRDACDANRGSHQNPNYVSIANPIGARVVKRKLALGWIEGGRAVWTGGEAGKEISLIDSHPENLAYAAGVRDAGRTSEMGYDLVADGFHLAAGRSGDARSGATRMIMAQRGPRLDLPTRGPRIEITLCEPVEGKATVQLWKGEPIDPGRKDVGETLKGWRGPVPKSLEGDLLLQPARPKRRHIPFVRWKVSEPEPDVVLTLS